LFIKPQARADVRALVGAVALGSTVGLAIGGAYLAGGLAKATVVHAQIQRLAGAASGGFSDTALNAATGDKDAAVLAIAQRHDPLVADVADPHDRQVAALVDRLEARQAARSRAPVQPAVVETAAAPAAEQPVVMKAAFIQPSRKLSTKPTIAEAAAQPFHLRGALDQSRDLECLTQAVYYESRGESRSGQSAVAQVILNRVRHPAFPKSVCGVVFQGAKTGGCQFSFACDGQPHHPLENASWRRAESVAAEALDGQVMAEVGDATHFHVASSGSNFSAGLLKVAQIGAHVFYRFGGHKGAPAMFHGEPEPSEAGPTATHPVFASLALSGGSVSPAKLLASASAAVEHAATAVENAAKGVGPADKGAATPVAAKPAAAPAADETIKAAGNPA
jgi:spore germination cell wall hydrolase CwlJ-like protein